MRRTLPIAVLLLACAASAHAQEAAPGPPPVLVMIREQFKPGSMEPHNKQIPAFNALLDKAKAGSHRLGLLPLSGDQNHLLYLEGYPSLAEMDATQKKTDAALDATPAWRTEMDALLGKNSPLHESQRTWIAVLRSDMSYRPNPIDQVAKARFVTLVVTRLQPGHASDYVEYTKQTNAAREKAKLDEHSTVYQVTLGAPAGTYLTLSSQRSLAESDEFRKNLDARTKALNEALGGEGAVKKRQEVVAATIAETAPVLYAVDRAISRPSPEFAAYDPEFWKPKKEPAKKEAPKK